MLNIFRKKTKIDVLEKQYTVLLKEARRLSTSNRRESDAKYAESDRLLREILKLEKT